MEARVDAIQVPKGGRYTILTMDYYGTGTYRNPGTGLYGISLQLVSDPGSGKLITYGSNLRDTIKYGGQMNSYTFMANANDVITVRMATISATSLTSLNSHIEIYSPDGVLIT